MSKKKIVFAIVVAILIASTWPLANTLDGYRPNGPLWKLGVPLREYNVYAASGVVVTDIIRIEKGHDSVIRLMSSLGFQCSTPRKSDPSGQKPRLKGVDVNSIILCSYEYGFYLSKRRWAFSIGFDSDQNPVLINNNVYPVI